MENVGLLFDFQTWSPKVPDSPKGLAFPLGKQKLKGGIFTYNLNMVTVLKRLT